LPEVKEGALIGNILEQSMYYATSLARVGLDFRGTAPLLSSPQAALPLKCRLVA
jgi:hypothetical protein